MAIIQKHQYVIRDIDIFKKLNNNNSIYESFNQSIINYIYIYIYYVIDCKKLFHTKCIQNGGVLQMPCIQQNGSNRPTNRRKHRKPSSAGHKGHITPSITNNQSNSTVGGKFSLTGTSEFTDRTDKIISDVRELKLMQDFITKKVSSFIIFFSWRVGCLLVN